jgi:hypothetical protein
MCISILYILDPQYCILYKYICIYLYCIYVCIVLYLNTMYICIYLYCISPLSVSLNLRVDKPPVWNGDSSGSSLKKYGEVTGPGGQRETMGLEATVDPITLLPKFTIDISMDDMFGPLDLNSWSSAASIKRREGDRLEHVLRLTS